MRASSRVAEFGSLTHSHIVKTTGNSIAISVALAVSFYLGSYLYLLQPRPQNPFLSMKITPVPLVADYRLNSRAVQYFYEPLAQLDQQMFPKRWQRQPSLAYLHSLTNMDLESIHEAAKRQQVSSNSNK
jgi:hypothetical protein